MIKTISDMLQTLINEEAKKLNQYDLKHGPTIGKMYEGLTSSTLERIIPPSLNLQVVSGIIHDGNKNSSGEIDCMLVKGEGEKIPYTDSFKWHVKDVLVIFEVKKNLYSDNLKDSFEHLRDAVKKYSSYVDNADKSETLMNIEPAKRAFKEVCGKLPDFSDDNSDCTHEMIYHTLVMEQVAPIRIVLGFNSYKSEHKMRESLINYIGEKKMEKGFGIGSFPQLMICGDYSLVKLNGQPYSSIMQDDYWDFYASSNEKPILLMLELIWTKIVNEMGGDFPWGDDLQEENLARLLGGKIRSVGSQLGWEYRYINVDKETLKNRDPNKLWEPAFVDEPQFIIFNKLCSEENINTETPSFLDFITECNLDKDKFIDTLIKTGMVTYNSNKIELSTYECRCAIMPDGRFAVAEDNSGRFTRWVHSQSGASA
jgi:hypothetical protein